MPRSLSMCWFHHETVTKTMQLTPDFRWIHDNKAKWTKVIKNFQKMKELWCYSFQENLFSHSIGPSCVICLFLNQLLMMEGGITISSVGSNLAAEAQTHREYMRIYGEKTDTYTKKGRKRISARDEMKWKNWQ